MLYANTSNFFPCFVLFALPIGKETHSSQPYKDTKHLGKQHIRFPCNYPLTHPIHYHT